MNREERETEAVETDHAARNILLWLGLGALIGLGIVVLGLWFLAGKLVGL